MLIPKTNATKTTKSASVDQIVTMLIYVMQETVREIFVIKISEQTHLDLTIVHAQQVVHGMQMKSRRVGDVTAL